jgi:hypothetical protein
VLRDITIDENHGFLSIFFVKKTLFPCDSHQVPAGCLSGIKGAKEKRKNRREAFF